MSINFYVFIIIMKMKNSAIEVIIIGFLVLLTSNCIDIPVYNKPRCMVLESLYEVFVVKYSRSKLKSYFQVFLIWKKEIILKLDSLKDSLKNYIHK